MKHWTEDMISAGLDRIAAGLPTEPETVIGNEPERDFLWLTKMPPKHLRLQRIKAIIETVSRLTGVDTQIIYAHSRHHAAARARHLVYYAARMTSEASLPVIADILNRDHSTVVYGIRKVMTDPDYFEPELTIVMNLFQQQEKAA